ncbi:MAG: hypothetical protein A2017_02615 [Lentisphaerae bacterium GWF2_44_16]|nr:MAG: hypothetical protein A2017_02615 [Lentisphaerae bacterium GWF2_44_16]
MEENKNIFENAEWIWLNQNKIIPNQYVCFRNSFNIDDIANNAEIFISVDTDFIVYLNGKEAGRGQFPDYPLEKTYSKFAVNGLLRKGINTIAVLAYYCGEDFSTYRKGNPGLIVALKNSGRFPSLTGKSWKAVQHPAFRSGIVPKTTVQLGFTVFFDARKDIANWASTDFDDSGWQNVSVQHDSGRTLSPRPLPSLSFSGRIPADLIMRGELKRTGEYETPAMASYNDMFCPVTAEKEKMYVFGELSCTEANGYYVVYDLKELFTGMISISVEAPAGTVLDISHGEHLDDGRVRCWIGGRNFTDRYICAEGENDFTFPFRRAGCRFVEVHFTNSGKYPVRINYIGLRPLKCSTFEDKNFFRCNDAMANKLHSTAVRTLEMCMHDHYEDCPWREQALYSYDSRNQALYGYYLWGNYDFAETSIDLLGRGIREDGLLELCAPAKVPVTIPIFSFVWLSEIYELYLHSGRLELFNKHIDTIKFIMDTAKSKYDSETGLYLLGTDKCLWHFYEWTDGLSGERKDGEIHAAYNIHFYEMLCVFSKLLKAAGQSGADEIEELASRLSEAINKNFWDNEKGCYVSKITAGKKEGTHEYVQAVALYNNLADNEKVPLILEKLRSKTLKALTLSSMLYMHRALMGISPGARAFACKAAADNFEPVVLSGSSTLWETVHGSSDFSGAGSLCHGWSSLPAYHYNCYVLGIFPIEAGFKKFRIAPYPDRFYKVEGTVPTPYGDIKVEWRRIDGNRIIYKAEGPEELEAVFKPYSETEIISASYNSRSIIK